MCYRQLALCTGIPQPIGNTRAVCVHGNGYASFRGVRVKSLAEVTISLNISILGKTYIQDPLLRYTIGAL